MGRAGFLRGNMGCAPPQKAGPTSALQQKTMQSHGSSLFKNKMFMLDEMTWRNASKFAIFLEYKNQHSFFSFFISCYLIFSLMNSLVYFNIDQPRIHQREKIKQHEMKYEGELQWFSYSKNTANFEAFRQVISSSINLLFLKSATVLYTSYTIHGKVMH